MDFSSHLAGVRILVLADEPIAREALACLLSERTGADARPQESLSPSALQIAPDGRQTVLLWSARAVARETIEPVVALRRRTGVGLVLLTEKIEPDALTVLLEPDAPSCGVLRRASSLTSDDLIVALDEASRGRSTLDAQVVRPIIDADGDSPFGSLSAAEHDVAALVARGWRNSAIARRLCKSERTIEKQVAQVFDKLGLSHRRHAGLDRRVAAARMLSAAESGTPLDADTLGSGSDPRANGADGAGMHAHRNGGSHPSG